MYHARGDNLPFVGSSHAFVGAEHGNTNISVFLFHGKPGSDPGPHRHPKQTCGYSPGGTAPKSSRGPDGATGAAFVRGRYNTEASFAVFIRG
jgi:hypothetical protein